MTTVDTFVEALREHGVEWMASLCGHGLDPIYDAARRAGVRLVDTRNEQTAGYIAESYGRLTRRPGVCAASSGIAHINALTGVMNAWFDSAPMLLISGAAAVRTAGMGHFQDADQVALASSITKFARLIDHPERVRQLVDEAFRHAVAPPCGPVHLTFPMDVQRAEATQKGLVRTKTPTPALPFSDPKPIVEALTAAKSPLIVAGSGVWYACEGEELARFSERFSIPVVTPIWDRGSIMRPISTFMGVIGAASGGPRLLPDADCIVLAGAVADYRLGYLEPGAAIRADAAVVQIDHGWDKLQAAYEQGGGANHSEWLNEAVRRRAAFRQSIVEVGKRQAQAGLHAVHLISALRQAMTDDTVLLIDGGNIGQWAHQLLADRYPGHWLTCGRSGVVGWGLGGAMGARLAYPDRPVILLSGDGAFTFTPAELECAARQKLPFVAIVADDEAWGITQTGHVKQFGTSISSGLGRIEFDKLAESFGARGILARTQREVQTALETGLSSREVTVIHAPIVGGFPGE